MHNSWFRWNAFILRTIITGTRQLTIADSAIIFLIIHLISQNGQNDQVGQSGQGGQNGKVGLLPMRSGVA